jgi:hypothetical protein
MVQFVACGGAGSSGFNRDDDGGGGSGGGGGFGGSGGSSGTPHLDGDGSSGSDSPSGSDCSDAAKLVYVIDDVGRLYSFDPGMLVFHMIGTTSCPGGSMTNSMAVDRSATAWVNDVNGQIYKVSTADASCEATSFVPHQHGFGPQFGMGFSADVAGGTAETLYVDGIGGGNGLATIDLTTMTLNPIAPFSGAIGPNQECELTGTGSGLLYGFFTTTPASVAQIDKTNATVLTSAPQAGVNTGTDWAFSFWGGSFYLYTANQNISPTDTSDVTKYDPTTGGPPTVVLHEIGFRIVGAGVSTCAPTTPPPVK